MMAAYVDADGYYIGQGSTGAGTDAYIAFPAILDYAADHTVVITFDCSNAIRASRIVGVDPDPVTPPFSGDDLSNYWVPHPYLPSISVSY